MAATKADVRGWDGEMSSLIAEAPACVAKVCYEYDNTIMSYFFPKKCIEQTMKLKLRSDDVFVITYPKTGTTWAQHIMLLVRAEGDLSYFEGKHIAMEVPFLEAPRPESLAEFQNIKTVADFDKMRTSVEISDAMPTDRPRILKTHVVPAWLPEGLKDDPKAKVVYVARNPKDTAVSYYHFCKLINELPKYASWDEFFEEFVVNRVPGGSWFDHTLYWWKLRNHPNVLFLTYEDMKQDSRKAVVQIAEFMGKSFPDDVIDGIVEATSFKSMKTNKSTNPDMALDEAIDKSDNKSFMRKGIVGDWKNFFSEDQNRRFDQLYREKIAGSGLELRFE